MIERKNEARWLEKYHRWQINVQRNGHRKTFYSKIPGTKGKIEAERQADKWLNTCYEQPNIRFDRLYADFLAEKELHRGLSTSGIKQYTSIGRVHLLPLLANKKAQSITQKDWQLCIDTAYTRSLANGKPISRRMLKNIRATIKVICSYAERQCIPLQPPGPLVFPAMATINQRTVLQPTDIRTVFSHTDYQLANGDTRLFWYIHLIRFILFTGLRPGEAIGIQPEQDIRGDHLHIQRSINYHGEITQGKNKNARRVLYLSPTLRRIVDDQLGMLQEHNVESPWLFPGKSGDFARQSTVYRIWRQYRDYHGLSASHVYELRHTMATATKHELPEHLLKMILGHSAGMDTYGTYVHEYSDDLMIAAEATERAYHKILGLE